MGWDAFGLPAEQYAIKNNVHPAETTRKNIATFRRQIQSLGLSYDWDREVDTTDPAYYKWTQWIFLQLFNSYFDPRAAEGDADRSPAGRAGKTRTTSSPPTVDPHPPHRPRGSSEVTGEVRVERLWRELTPHEQRDVLDGQRLAYQDEIPVNWCPGLGTVLSNEEVIDGKSERRRLPRRAPPAAAVDAPHHRLRRPTHRRLGHAGLARVAEGDAAELDRQVRRGRDRFRRRRPGGHAARALRRLQEVHEDAADDLTITVFTTRPDTLYGATYVVLAPEHELVDRITEPISRTVRRSRRTARMVAGKSDRDRHGRHP